MGELSSSSEENIKPRKAAWRYNEDGTYNNKPTDKDYFKKYVHTHFIKK